MQILTIEWYENPTDDNETEEKQGEKGVLEGLAELGLHRGLLLEIGIFVIFISTNVPVPTGQI